MSSRAFSGLLIYCVRTPLSTFIQLGGELAVVFMVLTACAQLLIWCQAVLLNMDVAYEEIRSRVKHVQELFHK